MTEIRRLLDQIQYNQLVMPAFQREYVWKLEQAKELLGSLYRQYPTGSLLFWETTRPPELKNSAFDLKPGSRIQVILDGQQRLTTLYLLIKDAIPPYYSQADIAEDPRHLHFNLETAEFKYHTAREMDGNPLWRRVSELYKTPLDPLEVALARVGADNLPAAIQLQRQINTNLNRLNAVLDQDYPVQMVPDAADITDAIRIFDLVNSQGTKLSEAELALAHMSGQWPDVRRVLKDKIAQLKSKDFEFDLTFMVRCMTAVVTGRAEYEQIHKRVKAELMAGWAILDGVLDYLVGILRTHAFIHSTYDLNTANVLVPLVVFLAQNKGQFANAKERDRFLHWMYAALLWSRYSGQTDQRLDKDVSIVLKSANPTQALINEILDQRGRIQVRPGDMEGRDIRNPLYRMSFIVAKSKGAVDWFTGAPLSTLDLDNKGANIHIFPYDRLYGRYDSSNHLHQKLVNEIGNRLILTAWPTLPANQEQPQSYLADMATNYPANLAAFCIPPDRNLWHIAKYEEFLGARRRLLADAINGFLDKLVAEEEATPTEDLATLIAQGETETVEFKATLRLNLHTQKPEPKLRDKAAAEVAAFMNGAGGKIIVGVRDDGSLAGIQPDLHSFNSPTEDDFQLYLQEAIKGRLGMECLAYVHIHFATLNTVRLCLIAVEPTPMPVYFHDGVTQRDLYVRLGTSAQKLDVKGAMDYIKQRWGQE